MPGVAGRAGLYGLVLGIVVFIALQSFVEYMPENPVSGFNWLINLGLMGVIWWCAHRLTWDSTFIDENVDVSGAGILELMGFEEKSSAVPMTPAAYEIQQSAPAKNSGGLHGWWDRYARYQDESRNSPHAPGIWIVYFSLAALPIFGLGQSLISADDGARRQKVFWLMVYYVAAALGLLLTTSFLNLRRYLRQRRMQMPLAMTGVWLAIGSLLIAVLLIMGAFLPRPNSEYPLITLPTLAGSPDRNASQYAVLRDSPGQGQGRPGTGEKEGRDGKSTSGAQQGNAGQKDNGNAGNSPGRNSASNQGNQQGSGGNSSQAKSGSRRQGDSDGNSHQSSERSGEGKDNKLSGPKAAPGSSAQEGSSLLQEHDGTKPRNHPVHSGNSGSSPARPETSSSLLSALAPIAKFLKWIVFALAALVVALFAFRAMLRFLANFTGWAQVLLNAFQNLWQSLFGWITPSAPAEEAACELELRPVPRPFASFRNPFATGMASQKSPEELVRYSFEALEAWASEHGLRRQADDTPLEFADRIALETPALAVDGRRLAALYARAAYARGRLPNTCLETVRRFWQKLQNIVHAPNDHVTLEA